MVQLVFYIFSFLVFSFLLWQSNMIRYIPNGKVGIVEKLWSLDSKERTGGLISLEGEPGYQPDILLGGFHFFFPFQYQLHIKPAVTVPQGQLAYVFARDGKDLSQGQKLASNIQVDDFANVRHFLAAGGQKGPQRKVLREGTHFINLAQFVVLTQDAIYSLNINDQKHEQDMLSKMSDEIEAVQGFFPVVIKDAQDLIGIVTVHDGPSLDSDDIIAPVMDAQSNSHNSFQNADAFLDLGGRRGRQLQVLLEGSYYINRLFATVELIPKTEVQVGEVGVVISYTGPRGSDRSGAEFTHGELVARGERGVWNEVLQPGKYAFNTYAGQVVMVPTVNFILKWSKDVTGAHKLDENLMEVSLITKDAFEPCLPLSVVVHIDYKKAPYVIQRFGDIKKLVEQTLDPMVSAYFKNIGQTKTLIELLQDRSDIQARASQEMRDKFHLYSLELMEVLIGTPHAGSSSGGDAIRTILDQLRQRQIAREQIETFALQRDSAVKQRELREAQAISEKQTELTNTALDIQVSQSRGESRVALARKDAEVIEIEADANKARVIKEGEAQASQIAAVGSAEAGATRLKVEALEGKGGQLQVQKEIAIALTQAIAEGRIPLVPQIQMGQPQSGSASSQFGDILSALMIQKHHELQAPVASLSSTDTEASDQDSRQS